MPPSTRVEASMGDARPFCAWASARWASELKRSLSSGSCWVERWCMAAPTAALNAALEPRPEALGMSPEMWIAMGLSSSIKASLSITI